MQKLKRLAVQKLDPNKNIIMSSFKSSRDFQKKEYGPDSCSDNQSSSLTLNELAKKARKIYCNFEFQRRSHTMTEIKFETKIETLRREIKADIRKQHDLYVNNLVGDVKANHRDFYRYINSQKKYTQGITPLKKRQGGGLAQSDFEKASEFNGQFTDVFTKSEHSQVPLLDRSVLFMEDIVVTKEGATKLLKGLNPLKALGPDEFHPRVLKGLASESGPIFAHLFQQSIDKGEIPKEWSLANICPLFKKGDRSLACNYRPVSFTSVPCKLLEHIVCSNIMAHLEEH